MANTQTDQLIQINGEFITNAGMIGKVIHETPTRVHVEIVDVFFPVHQTRHGEYQIDQDRQDYLRELIVGQKRQYWFSGTRANMEVGGNTCVEDWVYVVD